MKHGDGMLFAQASEMCRALIEILMPGCKPGYCREAGSIRRMKLQPNDIEIVVCPTMLSQSDLFGTQAGTINAFNQICDELLVQGVLEKRPDKNGRTAWGDKLKRGIFYQGDRYAPVDLFAVLPPAQWGVIYAIRTGPGDFNRLLVTSQRYGGACPLNRKVAGGRVWDMSNLSAERQSLAAATPAAKFVKWAEGSLPVLATPTESDFFTALRVPLWRPRLRSVHYLKHFLQERAFKAHITGGKT